MRLIELRIQNFMSLAAATLNFQGGIHFVTGKNWDMGADEDESNGSGKSSLFEAIQWCLFGTLARGKVPVDSVVNQAAGMDCAVQLVFEHNGHRYDVLRTRKHQEYGSGVQVWKDSVPLTAHVGSETEFDLTQELPINEKIFRHAVQVGQGMPDRFLAMSEPEKHDLICKIINLSVFDQALANARANAKAETLSENVAKETLVNTQRQHDGWVAEREQVGQQIAAYREQEAASLEAGRQALAGLGAQLAQFNAEVEELSQQIATFEQEIKELDAGNPAQEQALSDAEANVTARQGDVTQRYNDLEALGRQMTQISSDIQAASEQPNRCVLCKKIPKFDGASCDNLREYIQQQQGEHARVAALYQERLGEYNPRLEAFEKWQAEAARLRKEVEEYRAQSRARLSHVNALSQQRDAKRSAVVQIQNQQQQLQQQISEREQVLASLQARWEQLNSTVVQCAALLEQEAQKRDEAAVNALHWKYWVDNIPNLRASAVSKILVFVNGRIDHYMKLLSSGAMGMELFQKTHGKSSKIQVDLRTPGGTYAASSGGERRRVDLAVFLALFDLLQVSSGVKFNVLVCDEIMDGLSPSGVRRLVEILKEKASDGMSVFVISHNPSVQQVVDFDSVITVERRGGRAHLTGVQEVANV